MHPYYDPKESLQFATRSFLCVGGFKHGHVQPFCVPLTDDGPITPADAIFPFTQGMDADCPPTIWQRYFMRRIGRVTGEKREFWDILVVDGLPLGVARAEAWELIAGGEIVPSVVEVMA
jgi:hypothetical protein